MYIFHAQMHEVYVKVSCSPNCFKDTRTGPSQLARFAQLVGVRVSQQAIAARLTEQTAKCLHRVLEHAVQIVLLVSPLTCGVVARFPTVILEDASSIELPGALAFLWKGYGGSASASSIILGVRWDIRSGQLQGPLLQDGKSHETDNAVHTLPLPVGGVWVADAGYYSLLSLRQLTHLGIFLSCARAAIWPLQHPLVSVCPWLPLFVSTSAV
jgi:hypothetical protein